MTFGGRVRLICGRGVYLFFPRWLETFFDAWNKMQFRENTA